VADHCRPHTNGKASGLARWSSISTSRVNSRAALPGQGPLSQAAIQAALGAKFGMFERVTDLIENSRRPADLGRIPLSMLGISNCWMAII